MGREICEVLWLRNIAQGFVRDWQTFRRHGKNAPRYAECLYVRTAEIHRELVRPIGRSASGKVAPRSWLPETRPILENPKIAYCLRHFRNGESWKDAGAIDYHMQMIDRYGSIDRCRTRADVLSRLDRLDRIWEQVHKDGYLRPAADVRPMNFREFGGILMHLGPRADPIFGVGGQHRLGMAIAAELPLVPCQIGVVHPMALSSLRALRAIRECRALIPLYLLHRIELKISAVQILPML